jgi:DNA-binding transcriptional LysR family regulator
MQWRKIRSALEVAKHSSFTRAADHLHVSQPALSEQVKQLEDSLGFPLFLRTSRGVEVTEKGRTFLHEAARIANEMVHLQDVANNLLAGSTATIKIGLISGLAPLLVQRIFPLDDALQNKQLEIHTAPTRTIFNDLFEGRLDMGFAVGVDPDFIPLGLTMEPLFDVELALIVPPRHPLSQVGATCSIAQIAGEPMIMNELSVGYGLAVMKIFGRLGLHPRIQAVVDNVETVMALVEAGVGIALVPVASARNLAALGRLTIVAIEPAERITVELYRPRAGLARFKEEFYRQIVSRASHSASGLDSASGVAR